MKKRYVIALFIIIIIPLFLVLFLGIRMFQDEEERSKLRTAELFSLRLKNTAQEIAAIQEEWNHQLETLLIQTDTDAESLYALSMGHPWIRQAFLLDARGILVYPVQENASTNEQDFLYRSETLINSGRLPRAAAADQADSSSTSNAWLVWYWREGSQWVYWQQKGPYYLGFDINKYALLSELAGSVSGPQIPQDVFNQQSVILYDDLNHAFMQWGGYSPSSPDSALARISLSSNLNGWELRYFAVPELFTNQSRFSLLILGTVILSLLVVMLVTIRYLYVSVNSELKLAGQRISFVNQVSHELKTPLTNIRLYTDLLERKLNEKKESGGSKAARLKNNDTSEYVHILQRETEKLSRLINNVLTFGRTGSEKPQNITPRPGCIDDAIKETVTAFAPSFREQGIEISLLLHASSPALFDPDCLDQIMGNLLSNAGKYAGSGRKIEVESHQDGNTVSITVRDWGKGIPGHLRGQLFKPFVRLHTAVTDAAGGTGLGLVISRDLARKHGGDLVLEDSEGGCVFCLTINAPLIN